MKQKMNPNSAYVKFFKFVFAAIFHIAISNNFLK